MFTNFDWKCQTYLTAVQPVASQKQLYKLQIRKESEKKQK